MDGDAAVGVLHQHDAQQHRGHGHEQQEEHARRRHVALVGQGIPEHVEDGPGGPGQPGDDAGEDQQGDAVADAPFGDLLAEPHHEDGAGGEGEGAQQLEGDARDDHHVRPQALGQGGDAEALDEGQSHREVAGPLVDLFPACFAFLLLQVLQGRDHRPHQLQHDAGGDVGGDAQGEDGELLEGAAGEQIHHVE